MWENYQQYFSDHARNAKRAYAKKLFFSQFIYLRAHILVANASAEVVVINIFNHLHDAVFRIDKLG